MPYLLDTNAISEVMRPRPNPEFVSWLQRLPREEQYTSSVVVGELFAGAFASQAPTKWLERVETRILPRLTVLSFDVTVARVYGELRAQLRRGGRTLDEADLMIASTALAHDLTLVSANVRHFARVPGLDLYPFTPGDTRDRRG